MRCSLGALTLVLLVAAGAACGDDDTGNAGAGGRGGAGGAGGSSDDGGAGADCSGASSDVDKAVCAAESYLATLSTTELTTGKLAYTDSASRTKWSNLPGQARAGLKIGDLSTGSQAAALALMKTLLSDAGISDLTGVRAADTYLGEQSSGGGPGGGQYSGDNYYIAVFGTPTANADWAVTFGGHHMAYNITYRSGTGYPVPHHIGVEPKASFTVDGTSYAPLTDEGEAFLAVYKALSESELGAAYLSGQTFADVLIGPVEYGTGSDDAAKAKYPTGTNRKGVLVSSLSSAQQALVTKAIEAWTGDYNGAIADKLSDDYASTNAYADTLVAWGGTESAGVDPDVNGTYLRIDGPRLWLEVSCQAGVVIQGKTHYHTIFRDKQYDYGGSL